VNHDATTLVHTTPLHVTTLHCSALPFPVDCSVAAEKLYWGRDIEAFLTQHPDRFDILIAADVIYEEDQVLPLIETVVAILKGGRCDVMRCGVMGWDGMGWDMMGWDEMEKTSMTCDKMGWDEVIWLFYTQFI
jgi:Lysine methyltransferase